MGFFHSLRILKHKRVTSNHGLRTAKKLNLGSLFKIT
jgi:hypothetical protein